MWNRHFDRITAIKYRIKLTPENTQSIHGASKLVDPKAREESLIILYAILTYVLTDNGV